MKTQNSIQRALVVGFILIQTAGSAFAQTKNQDHWVATWAAAAQQPQQAGQRGAAPAAAGQRTAPQAPAGGQRGGPGITGLNNQTVRMIVRTSIGGQRLRVQFSNALGTT